MHRKLIALGVTALSAAALALPATSGAAARSVKVDDNFFSPKSFTVTKGTVVRFRFVGSSRHNVSTSAFRDISLRRSGTIDRKTRKKGKFSLRCTVHPGMSATLRVK